MSARLPDVVICAGGGGVGKTTTSAALALALARQGRSTLIVTIDPARRLAGAMGVPITDEVSRVPLAAARGKLSALMPDPRRSLHTFAEQLFEGEPEARARMLGNRLYIGLADATAGVHELGAMSLVARAASRGDFEVVVLDTAPSRQAIDFVSYPGRLAALLGGRTVSWLAGLSQRAAPGNARGKAPGGLLSWGTGHVEHLLARVTGPHLVKDTARLFGDLAVVRERFVALTQQASDLLLGPRAAYAMVTAPTAAGRDDVLFLDKRLKKLGRSARALIMNRADPRPPAYARALSKAPALPPALAQALALLDEERRSRAEAADRFAAELKKSLGRIPILRLPQIDAASPDRIVAALADEIAPAIPSLLPEDG
ncbi:MAG: ArsA-related P-loop ATPase [Byssovorax sp.]